jgi:putative phosphoesterase
MKIALISDTHNRVDLTQQMVEHLLAQDARYLIHAGDIGQDVANYLATLPVKCVAVYGNTDMGLTPPGGNLILQKQPYYFKIGETTFKLMHQPWFLSADSDVVVFGHLHHFECRRQKSLYINPGEVCAREKPRSEGALMNLGTGWVEYHYFDLERGRFHSERVCP